MLQEADTHCNCCVNFTQNSFLPLPHCVQYCTQQLQMLREEITGILNNRSCDFIYSFTNFSNFTEPSINPLDILLLFGDGNNQPYITFCSLWYSSYAFQQRPGWKSQSTRTGKIIDNLSTTSLAQRKCDSPHFYCHFFLTITGGKICKGTKII